jgi:hypothetical protein
MNIIQELESRGVWRLELNIIYRCWQNNISPSLIAKIMGSNFSIDDIERIIAYNIEKIAFEKEWKYLEENLPDNFGVLLTAKVKDISFVEAQKLFQKVKIYIS